MLSKHSGCVFYWVFLVIPNSLDFLDWSKSSKRVKKKAVLESDFQSFDHHRINCAFWGRLIWPLYWICLILWVWCSLLRIESYYIDDIITFIRNWMEESHTFLVAFHVSIEFLFVNDVKLSTIWCFYFRVFWPLYFFTLIPQLLELQFDNFSVMPIILSATVFAQIVLSFFSDVKGRQVEGVSPKDFASYFSMFVFGWLDPLVLQGYR